MLRLYRRIRQFMFRMYRWVNNWSFPGGITRTFSVLCYYFVKVCLVLGVPLLAIRYVFKGRSVRRGSVEEPTSDESSPSEKLETPSEDEGTGEAATPVLEPAFPVQKQDISAFPAQGPQESSPDDYSCEYDSTWDTDTDVSQDQRPVGTAGAQGGQSDRKAHRSKKFFRRQSLKFERFRSAAKDLQNYRHNYPNKRLQQWNVQDNENVYPNLDFYLGKRPSLPDHVYINEFHTEWRGKYDILESVHSYIQWLFPLQEPGVNFEARTLTKEEIEEFCQNDLAKKRLLESYKLMLDFYGIELCDEKTGEVTRAQNWIDRFTNLNRRTHNNLRITRILKCLGTLGFPHYQAPLVSFFLEETLVNGELPSVKDSVLNYFLFTVLDKKQRRSLLQSAYLKSDERVEFVWCPIKIQRKWANNVSEDEAS